MSACKCGCGAPIDGARRYATSTCRVRASRLRRLYAWLMSLRLRPGGERVKHGIYMERSLLDRIDRLRGEESRSAYIGTLLRFAVEVVEDATRLREEAENEQEE